jgi:hypothetical protein
MEMAMPEGLSIRGCSIGFFTRLRHAQHSSLGFLLVAFLPHWRPDRPIRNNAHHITLRSGNFPVT